MERQYFKDPYYNHHEREEVTQIDMSRTRQKCI